MSDVAPKGLQVIRLEVSSIKRLKAVDITPRPGEPLVLIGGRNEQGKSSTLDCIRYALEGAGSIEMMPIRKGEQEGHIRLDLGDGETVRFKILRTFHDLGNGTYDTTLKVETEDGMKGGQTALNKLIGKLGFDPIQFERAKPEEQVKMVQALVPGFDFHVHAGERKVIFDERTGVNRDAKTLEAKLQPYDDLPEDPVSTDEIEAELAKVGEVVRKNADARHQRDVLARRVDMRRGDAANLENEIAELEKKIAHLRAKRQECLDEALDTIKELEATPDVPADPDVAAIQQRLSEARAHNAQVVMREARRALAEEHRAKLKASEELTEKLKAMDARLDKTIRDAKFPVEGLSFNETGVTLYGVPFSQAGASGRLRASIAIAMALNPRVKVILVKDASLLDEDALEILRETAEENGFQIIAEVVGTSHADAIIIEDGRVRGAPTDS